MGRMTIDESTQPQTSDYESNRDKLIQQIEVDSGIAMHRSMGDGDPRHHKDMLTKSQQAIDNLVHQEVQKALDTYQHRMLKKNEELVQALREAAADYVYSEGDSCGEGGDHDDDTAKLAILLNVDMYDDGSGYDFYKYSPKRLKKLAQLKNKEGINDE